MYVAQIVKKIKTFFLYIVIIKKKLLHTSKIIKQENKLLKLSKI